MLKHYPPAIAEILARLNRSSLGWLGGAATTCSFWQRDEGQVAPTKEDVTRLVSAVSSINLWVGEGSMLIDSPSIALAFDELDSWAAGKPSRLDILYLCGELLRAVIAFEAEFKAAA